jgi:Na+/citrate or Na+/malate symporter
MLKDDNGSASLYVMFLSAVLLLSVLWILCTPVMNVIIGQYNDFIGEGWVSEQSTQTFDFIKYAWGAVPYGLIILTSGLLIRAYIMHDGGN